MLKHLTGFDNGCFKVLSFVGIIKNKKTDKTRRVWKCECRCLAVITLTSEQIRSKKPRSCGCYKQIRKGNEKYHDYHTTHGLSKGNKRHPVLRMWKNIKSRCYNAKRNSDFKNYKGKGITMLEEWKDDSVKFIDWVFNNGWKPGLTIDRIDSKKGYFPENIQFITLSENSKKVKLENPTLNMGINHKDATITDEIVKKIKLLLQQGETNSKVMKIMNVSRNIVYQIKSGKTWKHIEI